MVNAMSEMETLDWDKVAQQVGGGVSAQECIYEFARLPIAEGLLEAQDN